ncbi:MAG: hypothetical protein QXZ06_07325 [Candidatus Jordarchaeales archaeon]
MVNKIGGTTVNPAIIIGSPFVKQIPGSPKKNSLMKLFKHAIMNQNPLGIDCRPT